METSQKLKLYSTISEKQKRYTKLQKKPLKHQRR